MHSPFDEVTRFEVARDRGTPICRAVLEHVRQVDIEIARRIPPGEKLFRGIELFMQWRLRWTRDLLRENPDVHPDALRHALGNIIRMAQEVDMLGRPPGWSP